MSIEKKYTEEEIREIVDEEIRKAKALESEELSPNELENVSGGDTLYNEKGQRITADGEIFGVPGGIDKHVQFARDLEKKHGKDVARIWLEEMGYNIGGGKSLDVGIEELLRGVKQKYGGY